MTIRILIADDHKLVRKTLRTLLERAEGLEIVAEAENGRRALALAEELQPDIVLLDISMPRMTGLEATAHISQLTRTRVIVLSVHQNLLRAALENGASGYVLKQDSSTDLVDAIEQVNRGEQYVSPRLSHPTA